MEYMITIKKIFNLFSNKPQADFLLNKSKVFCMAPWVHQYIFPEGKVFPCCISAHNLNDYIGDLSKGETLEQIWNSEKTTKIRSNMLCEKKSDLCKLCYQYEALNKKSSRQEFNENFAHHINQAVATKPGSKVEGFNIRSIDFRFSNICNLTCRICSPVFSSKWHNEGVETGVTDKNWNTGKSIIYPVKDIEELWLQVEPLLSGLESIHFAGGEPLMMEEHYRILNYLIANRKTDVRISYNTNFSELRYKRYDVLELWKQLKNVSVCASLDGMGKKGELMRSGISWIKVEENRKRMLLETPHVSFQLTPTVSILNVLHLPDFFSNWIDRGLMKAKEINIYLLFEPYFYNIINLPEQVKVQVERKYEDFITNYVRKKLEPAEALYVEEQFKMVLNHMRSASEFKPANDAYMQFSFNSYNQALDNLRNENTIEVFPELEAVFSEDKPPIKS